MFFLGAAHAGPLDYVFTVIPISPLAGQPIQVNVTNVSTPCEPLPSMINFQRQGNTLRFFVGAGDACYPNVPPQNRTYDIGTLSAGVYLFQFSLCTGLPPGAAVDPCPVRSEQSVVVGGLTPGPRAIPALSSLGLMAMLAAILLVGTALVGRK